MILIRRISFCFFSMFSTLWNILHYYIHMICLIELIITHKIVYFSSIQISVLTKLLTTGEHWSSLLLSLCKLYLTALKIHLIRLIDWYMETQFFLCPMLVTRWKTSFSDTFVITYELHFFLSWSQSSKATATLGQTRFLIWHIRTQPKEEKKVSDNSVYFNIFKTVS